MDMISYKELAGMVTEAEKSAVSKLGTQESQRCGPVWAWRPEMITRIKFI